MNARKTKETAKPGGRTALINARLLDPASGRDEAGGLLIEDGVIADLGPHLRRSAPRDAVVVNCEDRLVIPGLVDMQVYTGEPGLEHRETLASASHAAAAGGVTTMIVMPATDPVIDDMALVDFVNRRGRDTAIVRVHTMAALTKGLNGREMSELGLLKQAGAVAFSNGRRSVASSKVMRRALTYAKDFDALVVHHTEDDDLVDVGVVNEGEISARLGLPGIPKAAEIVMVERDIRLTELSGGRYHAATISCRESLDAIRAAKQRKLRVSCGVSVNHLTLNENDVGSYRTFHKMRPPLRCEDDRRAMVEGIADGTIDVIVSAHDPQGTDGKRRPFADAAEGAAGVETLLPAALRLVHAGDVKLSRLLAALTSRPAALLGLPAGRLEKGAPADLAIVDLGTPWMLDRHELRSKAKNSPFDEAKFQGRVVRTLVAGETVFPFGG
jgi:dihydroorotase